MTTVRAISLSVLGLWLLGCSGTAGSDDDSAMAGTGGAMTVTEGGRAGTGSGGTGPGTGGFASSGGTMSGEGAGTAGTSMLGESGGRGGAHEGGASAGGAGSGGVSAGVSGGDPMGGVGGEGGRIGLGGRIGMGGRTAMGGAGGRSMAGMGGMAMGGSSLGGMGTSGAGGGLGNCPASGHVTYTLTKSANPTADEQKAYDLITEAMDKAVDYYNCYTNITKATTVTYVPSVETADGNSNGSIRFGGKDYMEYITAMHEIAHTVGIGTVSQWSSHVVNGIFTGEQATAKLREITGVADDQLHADTQHFWPYGLNYTSEVKSEADVIDHCYIVVAIRADLGLQ